MTDAGRRPSGSSAGARPPAGRRSTRRPSGASGSRPARGSRSGTSTPPRTSPASTRIETWVGPASRPFTRGVQATMYRSRFWTMRQYAGFSTAEETNARFRYLLEQGQTGLSVAFDLPTQMGYDSDAPEAEGEVGRVGVPISSLADMETLVDGIPLGEVSTSMTINATAATLVALYVAAAEKQGVERSKVSGHRPERHPQGVHRAGDLDLSAGTLDAARDRRLRVRGPRAPEVEHDLDLGLPHARGRRDRRPGAGVHARRRDRLLRGRDRPGDGDRRLRPAPELLLRRLVGAVRGGRQVPGRPPDVERGSCASGSARRTPVRWPAGSTSRPPARRSPRSRSTTTWSARPSRRSPRSSAAPRASTRTPATRRSPCRRRRACGWPSGPSRSSPTRRASPRPPIRWAARTSWRPSPPSWSGPRRATSTRSTRWAARCGRSRPASSSDRSRSPHTGSSGRSMTATRSSSA